MVSTLFLTMTSALLYVLPFFYPGLCWLMVLFIVPLYVLVYFLHKKRIGGAHFLLCGALWCLLVLNIHLLWFWKLLLTYGSQVRIIFGILTISYFSLFLIVPFLLSFFFKEQKLFFLLAAFTCAFGCSIYSLAYKSFLIFGCNDGYFLFDPMIPFMSMQKKEEQSWCRTPNIDNLSDNCAIRVQQVGTCIAQHSYKETDTCIIILPETTFPHNLKDYQDTLPSWCDCHEDIHLILGAHEKQGEKTYNCAYHIYNGEIVQIYKKSHLVPFFEYIPAIFNRYLIGEVFTSKKSTFSYPEHDNSDIFLINGEKYQLFICSELYQGSKIPAPRTQILFIGNNYWFCMDYAKKLAELYVDYFAWWHGCAVTMNIKK